MNTGKLTLAWLLALVTSLSPLAFGQGEQPLRYARIGVEDARIVNLPDANGIELMRPAKGTIVGVWRELAGWLEVDVPGGYLAWVHGRYLQETDTPGVYEVTRNAINIRPLPKSDVTSFPLPQRLHSGDRVRAVELADPSSPLSETWARIVTPVGVHAWVRSEQTKSLASTERGSDLWAQALAAVSQRSGDVVSQTREQVEKAQQTKEKLAAETGVEEATRKEIERLRTAIDEQRTLDRPDYTALRSELQGLATTVPAGPLRLEAERELSRLQALEEVARVRTELERERERRTNEVFERQKGVREASRAKDPLGAAFRWRGVLLRTASVNEAPRYYLRFGGRDVCEVLCTSGRYDMDLLAGNEVGVFGDEILGTSAQGEVVDVRRLEILKRR